MANYTIELGKLIESGFELFNFDYDFYDESKKEKLNQSFIDHFYFHEIGSETPLRFRMRFKTKWLEIISKYSKLFEEHEKLLSNGDVLSNYKTESKVVFNDTPKGEIEFDNSHATNLTNTKSNGYMGTTSTQLFKDFSQNYVNVLEKFLNEFNSLFMQIF